MHTDSEKLLNEGINTAGHCWEKFNKELTPSIKNFDRCCTHQVGTAHSKLLLKKIKLKPDLDYITFPKFGNCGSASLPITTALASQSQHLLKGHKVALLGIGSGINCNMTAIKW